VILGSSGFSGSAPGGREIFWLKMANKFLNLHKKSSTNAPRYFPGRCSRVEKMIERVWRSSDPSPRRVGHRSISMPNASPAESIAYQFDPYLSLLDKRDLGKVLKKSERSTKKKADYSLSPRRGPNSISVEGCGASPFEIRGSRDLVINPVALG
jgi:hypothetical protein